MQHWIQKEIVLKQRTRGFHLITHEIVNELPQLTDFAIGIAHIFICHTSASLSINENASPEVRVDMERHLNTMVPENLPYYTHTLEGPDDMPAHIKSSLFGAELAVPVTKGSLNLGTWQGIYLCEHRDNGGRRKIIVTVSGQRDAAQT